MLFGLLIILVTMDLDANEFLHVWLILVVLFVLDKVEGCFIMSNVLIELNLLIFLI